MKHNLGSHLSRWSGILLGYIAVIVSGIALVVGVGALNVSNDIKDSQRESCIKVGNPLLTASIALLNDSIAQTKDPEQIQKFFPNVSRAELEAILGARRKQLNSILDPLLKVQSCDERF